MITPRHPDTIADLAPDCRRVLRAEYQAIQVAQQPVRVARRFRDTPHTIERRRQRAEAQRRKAIEAAVADYRHTASLWGVDVD